jgi:hypothetical protein
VGASNTIDEEMNMKFIIFVRDPITRLAHGRYRSQGGVNQRAGGQDDAGC